MAALLYGNEVATTVKRSQVWQATHNGEGQTLPYMNRSFISFTFGGKKIEEFDLIATFGNDRLDRAGYASFKDTTSTYDNLDGQYYWSTHYEGNTIEFTLATDGIDQKKLDDFLHWFRAGVTRELVLAEHPNRAILARVSSPPDLSLLPFEQPIDIKLSSVTYRTSTTLYKGEISLSLTMDEPHWYAIVNILGIKDGNRYIDKWHDVATDQDVWIIESKDALKVLYEDGIPLGSMIDDSMLLGNGAYASVNNEVLSLIWSKPQNNSGDWTTITTEDFNEGEGAKIDAGYESGYNEQNDPTRQHYYDANGTLGIIAGAFVDISGNGITSLSRNQEAYFFYAGTAPAPTIITFSLQPQFNAGNKYLVTPQSKSSGGTPYNTITIRSENTQTFRFTTPNIFTSYNKVIKLFIDKVNQTYTWEDIRKEIRDNVRHAAVRAWANKVIEAITDNFNATAQANITTMCSRMQCFFMNADGTIPNVTFTFNSQTGEALGYFKYRSASGAAPTLDNDANWLAFNATGLTDATEDVGDMIKSNYIIIQDRNYATDDGKVLKWEDANGKRQRSHVFTHDCDTPLKNISILYKNMYL